MAWKCELLGCKIEKVKNIDKYGHYYLTRCARCGVEKVHFVREGAVYMHDKATLRAVRKCQKDSWFLSRCICYRRYKEIQKIEDKVIRAAEMESFCHEYQIAAGEVVPNPIILYMVNSWSIYEQENASKPKKAQTPPEIPQPDRNHPHIEVKYTLAKKKKDQPQSNEPAEDPYRQMTKSQLEKLLMSCVEKEEYEKAALIKEELDRRARKKKG